MCPSFPMKPSSACGAFCCAACACRALLSSTGSESSCKGRGTSLKRSATSCLLNSKQECQGLVPTASHGGADKLQWWHRSCHGWVFVVGYAGLSKGVCMSCNTELWGDAWASKDAGSSVAWLVWHELMCPYFSLEWWWWWELASRSWQGSMLSGHTFWGSLEKFSPAPSQAVLRGEDIICPPAAIALIQMTPSAPQSYRLTLLSEPELYLKRKKQPTTENQTQQQQKPPNFPTGRVVICLPCHFGSHSSSQPRAASFLLLLPRKLCHQLPPWSAGGQSPFWHALCGAAQGQLVLRLGSGLVSGRGRGAHPLSWEPRTCGRWLQPKRLNKLFSMLHLPVHSPTSLTIPFFLLVSLKKSCLSCKNLLEIQPHALLI